MTPEACIAYCNVNGYRLAGVEYGSECYCGDDYSNGAAPSLLSTACDMPCSGDVNKLCAGPSALMIYSNSLFVAPKLNLPAGWAPSDPLCIAEVPGRALTGSYWSADNMTVDICVSYCSGIGFPYAAVEYGWESLGCIAEGTQGRALISAQWESDSMTIGACLSYCSTRGYGMAGLEYGRQCFCAKDSLSNGASLAVTSNQCTMPCSGSILLPCGGPYALDLYQNPSIAKAVNEVTSAVGSWKDSKLCLQEVVGRALRGAAVSSPGMNVEYCLNYCGGLGFILAGVEYGESLAPKPIGQRKKLTGLLRNRQ
ncbi:hypothetical protein QFC24_000125 [Naganishia onofrii]|uniref:Uncharacterized protein n=1 Tax=Naganishia onofrii TaxID=1851511 RepID=A0ACC2XXI2_9TREE|nr:hypothetical protein QFC24_000125 [Naganishia onofrii]